MEGYTVSTANTAEDALQMIKDDKPDLIVLDIMLPEMDGSAMASELKESKTTSDIPIIFLTALIEKNVADIRNYQLSSDYFLAKPFENKQLLAMIRSILK